MGYEGRLIAGRLLPAGALSNVPVVLPAVYAKANGRKTFKVPCTYVQCLFVPHVPGTTLGAVKFIVNAVDGDTMGTRGDGAEMPGTMTDTDAKLQAAFGVSDAADNQQWEEVYIRYMQLVDIPMFDRNPASGGPAGVKTIDFLPVAAKDGTAAAAFDVYFLAAR